MKIPLERIQPKHRPSSVHFVYLQPETCQHSMPPESKTSELDLANKDKLKALELVYSFALTYSSSFNTVGAAVIFGLFSLLLLVSASSFLSAAWLLLSAAYLLTVFDGRLLLSESC